jgi:hypothetical protein
MIGLRWLAPKLMGLERDGTKLWEIIIDFVRTGKNIWEVIGDVFD